MSLFSQPKAPKPPPPPPSPPSNAEASVLDAGSFTAQDSFQSLINTGPRGLTRKATTAKRSLVGG